MKYVAWWAFDRSLGRWTCDEEVVGSTPVHFHVTSCSHTCLRQTPSSIIWHWPNVSDALCMIVKVDVAYVWRHTGHASQTRSVVYPPTDSMAVTTTTTTASLPKARFIAQQLNSTRRRVELSFCAIIRAL